MDTLRPGLLGIGVCVSVHACVRACMCVYVCVLGTHRCGHKCNYLSNARCDFPEANEQIKICNKGLEGKRGVRKGAD